MKNKEINFDKYIKLLITIQLIIFPFLDMLRTTNFRHIEFLGISLIELVNMVLIGSALLLTLVKLFKNKKFSSIIKLMFVFILYFIYIIIHYKHIINFDITIFSKASFNFITEAYYIIRVYLLPLLLLFILFENRDIFDKKFYLKIAKIVISIISFSIIVLDFFKISFISYSASHDFVSHNFIDYFLYSGDYKLLSGRGWFDSANELSAILLMLFPINVYSYYREQSKFNLLLLISQFLTMIILGTRTAAIGPVLINIVLIGAYLFLVFIKKEKYNYVFFRNICLITLFCLAYMLISPFMFGRLNDSNFDFSIQDETAYDELKSIKKLDELNEDELNGLDELMQKYSSEYLINEELLKLYPFNGDRSFWIRMAMRDRALNSDSRRMKSDIIGRIAERNNDKIDKYLGLGYTINFMDIERDYVYQYYLFGIFGLILFIFPYIFIMIKSGIKFLLNIDSHMNYIVVIAFMSPILGLAIAYLSGHVFGWVSPMMWLVFVIGFLCCVLDNKKMEVK